ncbi:MAG: hypothetical protein OIF38_00100, partial [Cellvibrionaceae bacterium]|nr:hypothetical protein [Cellvibrionaceae bacterium]
MLLKRLAVIGAVLLLAGCAQLPLGGTSRLVVDSINKLPKVLDETSGLAQQGGVFWSHNDSGGEAAVYAVNAQGDLLKTVHLRGAQNYDWEEMAQDADYLYVADIGDNRAKRQQLIIYAVAWDALSEAKDGAAVPSRQLTISIADKPEQLGKDHNFDFEGLTNVGDK